MRHTSRSFLAEKGCHSSTDRQISKQARLLLLALLTHCRWIPAAHADPIASIEPSKLTVNQQHLKQAWDVSRIETRADWHEWFKRFSTELLRESTSHALRACISLVDAHPPLGLDLFNAAFISCWTELYDQYQASIALLIAMSSDHEEG